MSKTKRTELYELGEFRVIDHLTGNAKIVNTSTITGVGDDAAVLSYPDKKVVVTTDLLLEGIHFDLTYFPLKHLGYKAVVVNLSDIYAMNATPKQITVSMGISKRFSLEDLEDIYSGIYLACERYGVDVVGGDTSSSITGLTISITAIGEADEKKLCYRHGAQINDLLCTTGDVGAAYMGLQLLEREKKVYQGNTNIQPKFGGYDYLLERYLKPEIPIKIIDAIRKTGISPTSMIDISDGLSSEALHICKNSKVGCRIYAEKIPIARETHKIAEEMNFNSLTAALNGGEDYVMLFTIPLSAHSEFANIEGITIIGHITEESKGAYLITPDGGEIRLTAQGWNALISEG